jgi:hypothetical protein
MLDFAFGFWKTKLKCEIVKAKTYNRKSKNSKLRQRRGEIEIISPFCASTFSGFRLSLIRVLFLHLRKQEDGRVVKALGIATTMSTPLWVRSSCVSRFQGTFPSSGFRRISNLVYRAPRPPQDRWPCENPISVKRSFISPSENLPLSLSYLHIRDVSSTYD